MIELIKYQLIVTICIIAFYVFYKIFLKNETFFNFNRFLILFLISISFAIPLVKIGTTLPIVPQKPEIITIGQSSEIISQPIAETTTNIPIKTANQSIPINWNLIALYAIGVINLGGIFWGLIRLTKSLLFFRYLRRKSEIATYNCTKFYIVPETIGSFSFFNSIFISKETINKGEVGSILAHELTHINEHHSLDSIFLALVKSFLWFNPIIYLFEKELKTVHEYIADSSVIKIEKNKEYYIDILLNQTIGPKMFDLTNNFNSTTIFRRLKMITKAKSTKKTLWKYLLLVIPIAFSLIAFSCTEKKNEVNQTNFKSPRTTAYKEWDKFPQPEMGSPEYHSLKKSIQRTPWEAKKHNISCQVFIGFDVNSNGKMSNFRFENGKIAGRLWSKKTIGYGIEEECIRTMKELAKRVKWNPAQYKGKPISMRITEPFMFGDGEKWKMYSVCPEVVYSTDETSQFEMKSPCKRLLPTQPSWFTSDNYSQIYHKIYYPEKALKLKKGGNVIIAFGITQNGDVSNPKIIKKAGYGLDEAALTGFKNVKGLKVRGFKHNGKRYKMEINFIPKPIFSDYP